MADKKNDTNSNLEQAETAAEPIGSEEQQATRAAKSPAAQQAKMAAEPADAQEQQAKKAKKYEITVHRRHPDDPPFVDVGVDGVATRIRIGERVPVTPEALEVLHNAQETHYTFHGVGGPMGGEEHIEEHTSPLYPVTVHGEVRA